MKRKLLLILALVFLFTACAETVSMVSSEIPEEESESSESGEKRYTLVSVGKPYTKNLEATKDYPDLYGQQLTDGQKAANEGAHYVDSRMVGFAGNCTIQIDLGEDGQRISAIVARALDMNQDGVTLAASARFSGSVDGKKFKTIGSRPFAKTGNLTISEARLDLVQLADYRYIRIQIFKGTGHFFFVDEVEVYADVPEKQIEDKSAIAYANEKIDRDAWQAASTGVPATPTETKVLTVGEKYTFRDCEFDTRAPEHATKLTDGQRTSQYFSDPVWVGIKSKDGKAPKISVALDGVRNNVYGFNVFVQGGGADVELPEYIDIYAAKEGKNTFLGRMYGPQKANNFTYTYILPEYIEVGNVTFEFPTSGGYYWIEEIQVIAGYNEEQPDVLFAPLDLPKVTEDIFWDASEPDYKKEQNLLLGLPQQVQSLFYADIDTHGDESKADNPCLTDGKKASTSSEMYCYSDSWFFSRGGDGIEVFYDLGKVSSINSVSLSVLEQYTWGITRPKFISVFLSDDAENWYEVVDWYRGDIAANDFHQNATSVQLDFKLDKTYAARFIYFRIENGFIFIDELEAFGTKQVKSNAVRLADSGLTACTYYTNPESEAFASPENTPVKAKDIVIVYGDRSQPESLLPLVAYLDENGNIKDTLMDGFLYCSHYQLPSGTQAHLPNYKQDWEYVLQHTFNGAAGFGELDKTVQQVKDALNIPDYKVQVYVTYLTLRESVTNFGDVDGDGISEDASTSEGRKKIIDWYIDETLRLFEEGNYQNLELNGFYWVNEAVIWEKDDSHVIEEVAKYTHEKGQNFLWVPYYKANRFFSGHELGFDLISMQPNVVFTTDAPLWRFPSTAAMTKARKMCVEIEHSYQALGDPAFARTYLQYLYYGATTGYMSATHVYYDDVDNFSKMGYSKSALCRLQYDATYNFIKETLDITPEKREEFKISGKKDTVIDGNLNEANALQLFTVSTPPKHGYVTVAQDGSFRYYPDKGYTGTDSFTYTYNEFLGESEPCTVTITVE